MKVAIFGSYNHGNYGDDLMAIMYGLIFQRQGYEVWVYRLDEKIASDYNFITTHSIPELIDQARLCVIGGGAHLLPLSDSHHAIKQDLDQAFGELAQIATEKQCPVYCVSIGGDGKSETEPMAPGHEAFFRSEAFRGGTVRLAQDVPFLKHRHKEVSYYQDVLWQTADFWKIQPQKHPSEIHIGINIQKGRKNNLLVKLLKFVRKVKPNVHFHFISLHLPSAKMNYELRPLPKQVDNRDQLLTYEHPDQFLPALARLDLIISAKLHLGLTALSFGVPLLSYRGAAKTRAMLKSIGYSQHIFGPSFKDIFRIALKVLTSSKASLAQLYDTDSATFTDIKRGSQGHINLLRELADQFKDQKVNS